MSNIKEINDRFGVSFHRGQRVFCDGRWGVIVGASHSHIRVRFDGRALGVPCDPRELQLSGLADSVIETSALAPQESLAHRPPASLGERLEFVRTTFSWPSAIMTEKTAPKAFKSKRGCVKFNASTSIYPDG